MCDFVGKPIDLAQLDAVLSRVAEERGAAAPAAPKGATLSRDMLSKLRQIESLGEPELVANLARRFVSDTKKRLPRMAVAFKRGDAPGIARDAHMLISSSATLGATEMSELCSRIERAAREGRLEEIGGEIDSLSSQLVEVERALERGHVVLIIVEGNQGGELVREVLRSVDAGVPVQIVHASRGKAARAEPVVALYEQGRVTHASGSPGEPGLDLGALEDELVGWVPGVGASPGRLDALVWAVTTLGVRGGGAAGVEVF